MIQTTLFQPVTAMQQQKAKPSIPAKQKPVRSADDEPYTPPLALLKKQQQAILPGNNWEDYRNKTLKQKFFIDYMPELESIYPQEWKEFISERRKEFEQYNETKN